MTRSFSQDQDRNARSAQPQLVAADSLLLKTVGVLDAACPVVGIGHLPDVPLEVAGQGQMALGRRTLTADASRRLRALRSTALDIIDVRRRGRSGNERPVVHGVIVGTNKAERNLLPEQRGSQRGGMPALAHLCEQTFQIPVPLGDGNLAAVLVVCLRWLP